MNYKVYSKSIEETIILAENIESEKFENMIICLDGELGTGKTIFVKGFAKALGIKTDITSPTFNIIKEYHEGEMNLYHMDVYRLDENDDIGIADYFNAGGVTIIEWSEIIKSILPIEHLEIKFSFVDENTRLLNITAYGEKYINLCEKIF